MQHDHILKKLNFDPNPRIRGVEWVGVCRQNICYIAAAFCNSILFDTKHDHVLKKLNFDQLTPSPGLWEVGGLQANYLLPGKI